MSRGTVKSCPAHKKARSRSTSRALGCTLTTSRERAENHRQSIASLPRKWNATAKDGSVVMIAGLQAEDDEDGVPHTNDPVRTYLRLAGTRALLNREEEVALAKRIEEGERRILDAVLRSRIAIEELLRLGDRLKKQEIRIGQVLGDLDEEDPEFDEEWHVGRVLKSLTKVAGQQRKNDHIADLRSTRNLSAYKQHRVHRTLLAQREGIFTELSQLRLKRDIISNVVGKLKSSMVVIERAEAEIAACERRAGMSLQDIRDLLRTARTSRARARTITK